MENSFRFYRNLDCTYFPCHKVENEEEFNCMFCYCPLYLMEDCGGNHEDKYGIKDCSNCLIPHRPKGYDYINKNSESTMKIKLWKDLIVNKLVRCNRCVKEPDFGKYIGILI